MSVKRYQPVAQCVEPSYQAQMIVPKVMEFSEGEYVLHSDYAGLKAEVEHLKAELADEKSANANVEGRLNSANRGLSMRNHLLQAEVERLRKAGDALYESEIGYYGEQILVDPKHHSGELCRNWNAAKEGKQP